MVKRAMSVQVMARWDEGSISCQRSSRCWASLECLALLLPSAHCPLPERAVDAQPLAPRPAPRRTCTRASTSTLPTGRTA